MITREEQRQAQAYAAEQLAAAGIELSERERVGSRWPTSGSRAREQGLRHADRYCAGARPLSRPGVPGAPPPAVRGHAGKEETFRCRRGLVRLRVGTERLSSARATSTIPPDTLHSFRAGPDGAVVSEFSSASRDELDVFTDPAVRRATVVA